MTEGVGWQCASVPWDHAALGNLYGDERRPSCGLRVGDALEAADHFIETIGFPIRITVDGAVVEEAVVGSHGCGWAVDGLWKLWMGCGWLWVAEE